MLLDDLPRLLENIARRIRALEARDVPSKDLINLQRRAAGAVAAPASGWAKLYVRNDGALCFMGDDGVEHTVDLTP